MNGNGIALAILGVWVIVQVLPVGGNALTRLGVL